MSRTYQRRLEQFQARLEQSLSLADDEIDRLTQYLNSLKAECLDITDKLGRFSIQYKQNQHERRGKKMKEQSTKETKLAILESEHNSLVVRLTKEHAERMNQIREDYMKAINESDNKSQKSSNRELKKLDHIISKLETIIKRENDRINGVHDINDKEEEISENAEANAKMIQETIKLQEKKIKSLQDSIKQREDERLAHLERGKSHFNSAMNTLEANEASHQAKIENLREVLESVDNKYKQTLEELKTSHKKSILTSKKRLLKAQKKLHQIQKQIVSTEETQQQKIQALNEKHMNLKSQYQQIRNKTRSMPSTQDIHNLEKQYAQLKQTLVEHENILKNYRSNNHALKREIARLQHNSRVIHRRSVLGL